MSVPIRSLVRTDYSPLHCAQIDQSSGYCMAERCHHLVSPGRGAALLSLCDSELGSGLVLSAARELYLSCYQWLRLFYRRAAILKSGQDVVTLLSCPGQHLEDALHSVPGEWGIASESHDCESSPDDGKLHEKSLLTRHVLRARDENYRRKRRLFGEMVGLTK